MHFIEFINKIFVSMGQQQLHISLKLADTNFIDLIFTEQ